MPDKSHAVEKLDSLRQGLRRARLWRFLPGIALERVELWRRGIDWILEGTIVAQVDGPSAYVRYNVTCDDDWRTRAVSVDLFSGGSLRSLRLIPREGRWFADGVEVPAVRGAVDVDLSWSPSTNTLPIRRLDLAVGASSGPVTAAWVRFPKLSIEPLPQEYTRLAEDCYRYTSRGGAFTAELLVDELGLVVDYGDVWRRVGEDG